MTIIVSPEGITEIPGVITEIPGVVTEIHTVITEIPAVISEILGMVMGIPAALMTPDPDKCRTHRRMKERGNRALRGGVMTVGMTDGPPC